tara:strand:+ start:618 stop:1409 length:792 start_codon:yes stop_codon:yes gene_type:complete
MSVRKKYIGDQIKRYQKKTMLTRIDTNIGRCYTIDPMIEETWKPSVTTIENIISKGIIFERWIANFGGYNKVQDYVGKKADDGTLVHIYIDELVSTGKISVKKNTENHIKKYLLSFEKWWNESDIIPVASEMSLYHKDIPFSGTADLICYIDGKLSMIDYKTGNEYSTTHRIQLCCYMEIFNILFPEDQIKDIYCLYVKSNWIKKPTYKLKKYEYDAKISSSLMYLWNFNNKCNRTKITERKEKILQNKYKIEGALNGTRNSS